MCKVMSRDQSTSAFDGWKLGRALAGLVVQVLADHLTLDPANRKTRIPGPSHPSASWAARLVASGAHGAPWICFLPLHVGKPGLDAPKHAKDRPQGRFTQGLGPLKGVPMAIMMMVIIIDKT